MGKIQCDKSTQNSKAEDLQNDLRLVYHLTLTVSNSIYVSFLSLHFNAYFCA